MRRNKQKKVHTTPGGGRYWHYVHRLSHMDQPDGYAGLTPVEDDDMSKKKAPPMPGKGGKSKKGC